jgi:hypothetical protein
MSRILFGNYCMPIHSYQFIFWKNTQISVWNSQNAYQLFCQGFGKRNVHRLTGTLDKKIHENHPDSSCMFNSQVWYFGSPYELSESRCKMKKTSSDRQRGLNVLSTTNEMQRYTIFFIVVSDLHVFSGFPASNMQSTDDNKEYCIMLHLVGCV